MGRVTGDVTFQKRGGDNLRIPVMTVNSQEQEGAKAVRPRDEPYVSETTNGATELSVRSGLMPPGLEISAHNTTQEKQNHSLDVEHPLSAISQPIPLPEKPNDEIEPPKSPKRKVSFAPDAFSFEEAMQQKGDQNEHGTPCRTPSHCSAQGTALGGSPSIAADVERILQARIRGPLMTMVALLLVAVILLVAISGLMSYFLLVMRSEVLNRTDSSSGHGY